MRIGLSSREDETPTLVPHRPDSEGNAAVVEFAYLIELADLKHSGPGSRPLLSRDGRMRNPNEKPLVLIEPPVLSEPEVVAKPKSKELKEEPIAAPQKNNSSVQKVAKEKNNKQQKEENSKVTTGTESTLKPSDLEDRDGISGLEKQEKVNPPPKIDEAKLKEIKREEEIAKAKQASERKKKLAEKAAVKAAIKAQKEAEKKLKEIIISYSFFFSFL